MTIANASTAVSVSQSAAASAAQEAQETLSQTKAEAAKGDSQAARRLARVTQPQAKTSEVSVPPGSSGQVINVKA